MDKEIIIPIRQVLQQIENVEKEFGKEIEYDFIEILKNFPEPRGKYGFNRGYHFEKGVHDPTGDYDLFRISEVEFRNKRSFLL